MFEVAVAKLTGGSGQGTAAGGDGRVHAPADDREYQHHYEPQQPQPPAHVVPAPHQVEHRVAPDDRNRNDDHAEPYRVPEPVVVHGVPPVPPAGVGWAGLPSRTARRPDWNSSSVRTPERRSRSSRDRSPTDEGDVPGGGSAAAPRSRARSAC